MKYCCGDFTLKEHLFPVKRKVDFKISANSLQAVFPKILDEVQLPSCPLHAGGQSGSKRKRRADFDGDYSIDFTIDPTDTPNHLYKDL